MEQLLDETNGPADPVSDAGPSRLISCTSHVGPMGCERPGLRLQIRHSYRPAIR